ncbi:hypothetical protein O6H91_10G107600 [Diphasiastrum complanatum]|uniref:Uncharacterized protein n=1 Tax=Diphasiastrum complanatum TaxID=34168 RepID=A0ACC2CKD3_DIPCM|nr:hypothetical protein O6H91_10G107600 [Diphasiastrum complanatum]
MSTVSLSLASRQLEGLTEEERRALRGSKFASSPLEPADAAKGSQPRGLLSGKGLGRLAHPGGALATNKAAALSKFLKRKLDGAAGASSLDPALVEVAVNNAKASLIGGVSARSKVRVRHVESFSDVEEDAEDQMKSMKQKHGDSQNQNSQAESAKITLNSQKKRRWLKKKKRVSNVKKHLPAK